MRDLLDVNVWIAAGVPDHAAHARAMHYWKDGAGEKLLFCRTTSQAFLRLLTAPGPTGGRPRTAREAWEGYLSYLSLPEVGFAQEPPGWERPFRDWISSGLVTHRLLTDAYLAAFALAAGLRLVTFDRDFARFPDLDYLLLDC